MSRPKGIFSEEERIWLEAKEQQDKAKEQQKKAEEERQRKLSSPDYAYIYKKGFLKGLEDFLTEQVNNKISDKLKERLSPERYFEHRAKIETRITKETDWVNFFQECSWLQQPTTEDVDTIRNVSNFELTNYCGFLSFILGEFWRKEQDQSEPCQKIHEIYKLMKQQIKDRGLNHYPQKDCLEDLEAKAKEGEAHVRLETKLEEARYNPILCPYCDSMQIRSRGHTWQCKTCKKQWRKR